jgi:hypothetical protein
MLTDNFKRSGDRCTIDCTEVFQLSPTTMISPSNEYAILLKTHGPQIVFRSTNQKVGGSTPLGRAISHSNVLRLRPAKRGDRQKLHRFLSRCDSAAWSAQLGHHRIHKEPRPLEGCISGVVLHPIGRDETGAIPEIGSEQGRIEAPRKGAPDRSGNCERKNTPQPPFVTRDPQ